jgi:ribosomal protein S18 acetylase RimI-like enzyme
MILQLEERALNAWPALETVYYDGWVLRCAGGYTRRANSVQALYPGAGDAPGKIRYCEEVYWGRGQDAVFKLTAAAEPAGLDGVLAAAGYRHEAVTSVQVCALGDLALPADGAGVTLSGQASEQWLDAFCRLNGVAARHRGTMARMLVSTVPAHCFLAREVDGAIVALGMAVVERGYVGLFDIVTAAAWRGRGLGRQTVLQLLAWGRARGAPQAYLQVMVDNAPALRLYAGLGFREAYPYWYRVKSRPEGTSGDA